jgi:hypothetical protein
MDDKLKIRYLVPTTLILCILVLAGLSAVAQEQKPAAAKPEPSAKSSGRDPFKKYEAPRKVKSATGKLEPPSIQMRIDRYRAQKLASANAHVSPPKPTTALLLNELQVTGIFRTPRGWSAMVEATPFNPKLSYVIYPGETFFDGQLVAIEEGRLVFRRDIVWNDGRREKTVEVKPLRAPSPVEAMTAQDAPAKDAPAKSAAAEGEKVSAPAKRNE